MSESRKEFEERMTRTYPLLYSDMYGDPSHTCMAFGFDIGPGWYPLLEKMSAELDPHIKREHARALKEQKHCAWCSRHKRWHWFWSIINVLKAIFINKWRAIKILPKRIEQAKKTTWSGDKSIFNMMVWHLLRYKPFRPCTRFRLSYPRASQVKEKFAELRFYMTWETEEIDKIIDRYEKISRETCEECGEPGECRDGGWMVTLCDKCEEERK